jgi:hypothetical protein
VGASPVLLRVLAPVVLPRPEAGPTPKLPRRTPQSCYDELLAQEASDVATEGSIHYPPVTIDITLRESTNAEPGR